MKYDIFISYRREDCSGRSNVANARQIKQALEGPPYHYKVFFDYSECTDNYFSDIILPAIRTCDFFVLVLTKDSLLRCSNEGDWVRREIEEAIAYKRKIIPITPDKECESFPTCIPDSLRKALDGLQITTVYTDYMFEDCIGFLVKNRFHLSEENTTNKYNGHEFVDLGLPSGTLWATCNVGADKPEDYGDYFAWGETRPKAVYDWNTYKFKIEKMRLFTKSYLLTKYCHASEDGYGGFTDMLTALQTVDDAATVNWGDGWRIPTKEQCDELISNTKNIWINRNGVYGRLFTASNDQSLFLPAAGHLGEGPFNGDAISRVLPADENSSKETTAGVSGYYWSRSLATTMSPYYAHGFYFKSDCCFTGNCDARRSGRSVRAVRFVI